jgi:phosphoglycolate phosphatase
MRRTMRQLGVPARPDAQLRDVIGLGLPETAVHLHPTGGPAFNREFVATFREHWFAHHIQDVTMFDGAEATLLQLRAAGVALAVATGKSRAGLARELRQSGFEHLVAASRCADETASKPDPRMLLEILAELDVHPDDAVVVGDTTFDLEMAQRGAVRSIAVTYGAHDRARLSTCDPVAFVDDVREIPGLL